MSLPSLASRAACTGAIAGDFDSSEMVSLLENGLRDWRGLSDEAPQRLPVSPLPQSREEEKPPPLHLVNIPGATQVLSEAALSLQLQWHIQTLL